MNWLVEKMKEDGSKNAIIFKGKEYTYEALVEQIGMSLCQLLQRLIKR